MQDEERYEIKGKVGEGGRGAVYRAYDRQLNRNVAIKRLFDDDGTGGDANAEVLKESHALSAINSPHIVRVFDISKDEEGPYVVMELLEGKTLHEVVSRAPLVPEDFMTVAEQALEALIAAHQARLLHRDIKPGNLMLTWLPSGRLQLKLLDFGLAKFTEKPAVQTIAQKGSVLGSIYFMAPEQFERTPLDARSDLYSLGCVLYYALTGQYPFRGESATEVMAAHIQGDCEDLAPQRPDLSPVICQWIMGLIARRQDDRPPTAQEALAAFELARKATAPVRAANAQANATAQPGPRLLIGEEAETATQRVTAAADPHTQPFRKLLTATHQVPTHTTSTTVVAAGSPTTKVVHTTKSQGLSPILLSFCGVLLITIIALGVAVAMRGDPGKTIPDPVPAPAPTKPPAGTPGTPTRVPTGTRGNSAKEFLAADKNKDFKLSSAEFVSSIGGNAKKLRQQFKKLDKDRNGTLSRAEFSKRPDLK